MRLIYWQNNATIKICDTYTGRIMQLSGHVAHMLAEGWLETPNERQIWDNQAHMGG
jgi:hypothetical protein